MTARKPATIPATVPEAQLDAHDRLLEKIAAADPDDVPCLRFPDPAWTSEDHDDAKYIARLCEPCPIPTARRSYVLEHHEPVGVWGGLTVHDRRRRARRGRAA